MTKKPKKKRPPRTLKEKMWLAKTIEYGNGTQAAREVYNVSSDSSAYSIAYQNFSKLQIDDALKAKGISIAYLVSKAQEGLEEAKKIHGTGDNFVELPDYSVKHKYLETLLRLSGHGSNSDVNVNVDNRKQYYVALPEKDE